MKLHEYQIEDVRAMMEEYMNMQPTIYSYDEGNSRALIRRFVEMVEGWVEDERREPVTYTHRQHPTEPTHLGINPYGDQR